MNNAKAMTNGDVDKTFNGFPTIKVGRSYKLQIGNSSLTAFCAAPDKFVVKAGSVMDMESWPNCLEPEYVEPTWGLDCDIMAVSGCVDRLDESRILTFIKDYDEATPLAIAKMAANSDDENSVRLWQEVFS